MAAQPEAAHRGRLTAVRFLVDGYNVTRRDPATASLPLDEQREALVARLAARGAGLLGRGPIIVVFDGVTGAAGSGERRGAVEVRYSRDEPADDLIVRLVTGGDSAVVTADNGLADRVRAAGARVLDADVCFEGARARRRRVRYPARTDGLPPGANAVTEELKRLWLRDGE